ncbi:MAG: serine protease AprX [Acidimicrobiaceae bacterium]
MVRGVPIVTLGHRNIIRFCATLLAALAFAAPASAALLPPPPPPPPMVSVIVQQWDGNDSTARLALFNLGGTITANLPVIGGFAASIPQTAVGTLSSNPAVRVVSADALVLPQDVPTTSGAPSVYRDVVGATPANAAGRTGQGVTVAVIDSGVSNVPDLAGRLVSVTNPTTGQSAPCVNLSTESGCADSYGHGTFVAGLIAGNGASSGGAFPGVAPAANILALKLSGADGTSNVSKVLAAIQWVLVNKDVYGIKVLNLSLRVDSSLSYRLDPVNLAVERAWSAGIVVVVSAGNMGPGAQTIAKPADDPWVISVGSVDDHGTTSISDDVVSSFSSRGPTATDGLTKPDVVVPGRSLVSLRSPGSSVDAAYPYFVDGSYRRGSGTSFSAGIVSGAAAVLLAADPTITNDRVKFALMSSGRPVTGATANEVGAGVFDIEAARVAPAGLANQNVFHPMFFPGGMSTAADFQGSNWQGSNWQGLDWQGSNWQGSNWQGSNWQGSNWQGSNWQGSNWQGSNWQGSNWQGSNWQGSNWQGSNWQGSNWQSGYWS